MPPKGQKAKKAIKEETNDQNLTQSPLLTTTKIPKRPFFRTVKYQNINQIQKVRCKLWKISRCEAHPFRVLRYRPPPQGGFFGRNELIDESLPLYSMHTSPTLKKSLKHVKKVKAVIDSPDWPFQKFFSRSWKLDSFDFQCFRLDINEKILRNLINPRNIKQLSIGFQIHYLSYDRGKLSLLPFIYSKLSKIIERFVNLRKMSLDIPYEDVKRSIRGTKLQKLEKLYINNNTNTDIFDHKSFQRLKNLETLCLPKEIRFGSDPIDIISALPYLEKLRKLRVNTRFLRDTEKTFLSIVKCSQLELLYVDFYEKEIFPFNELLKLKNLKSLFLNEPHYYDRRQQPLGNSFPPFEKLERIEFYTPPISFPIENLQENLWKNPNLKEMEIQLGFKDLAMFFKDDFEFSLHRFSLHVHYIIPPYGKNLKALTDFLKKQKQLKVLELGFSELYQDVAEATFKVLGSLTSLESFKFFFEKSGEMQDLKFGMLKDTFAKLPNLKRVTLLTKGIKTNSSTLSTLITGFMKLKNLEKFVYSANFHQQITESVIQKFVEFVKSIRHIKSFKFVIDGLSEESIKELKDIVYTKNFLSKNEELLLSQ